MKNKITNWIKIWFEKNGDDQTKAVIGISGGKDSSVVAALCVEALGRDRVFGVLMPQHYQADVDMSLKLVDWLGIKFECINIGNICDSVMASFPKKLGAKSNPMVKTNMPARIRMTTLYAIAACVNGRVANTCNKSEDWVGYSTKYGDSAGDFSPISDLTVTEVKQLGYELGLPRVLIEKVPQDGLCGKSDEDNLGFTYDVLDRYILTGEIDDPLVKARIDKMHVANLHKVRFMDCFKKDGEVYL